MVVALTLEHEWCQVPLNFPIGCKLRTLDRHPAIEVDQAQPRPLRYDLISPFAFTDGKEDKDWIVWLERTRRMSAYRVLRAIEGEGASQKTEDFQVCFVSCSG
jgi:hypothetical protein